MGGGGDAVNTEDQQVLILLHECPTETSRHAKRGGGSSPLSVHLCYSLCPHAGHWHFFSCTDGSVCLNTAVESCKDKVSCHFDQLPSSCGMIERSWRCCHDILLDLYWSAKLFNFVLWLFVSQINLKHEETHQTRLSSTPYLFLLIDYIIVTKTTIIHPSPQCSSSLSSCCSGFDISLHMTSIIQSHH